MQCSVVLFGLNVCLTKGTFLSMFTRNNTTVAQKEFSYRLSVVC